MVFDYQTGKQSPCPSCGDEECVGCNKPRHLEAPKKVDIAAIPANEALKRFLAAEAPPAPPVDAPDPEISFDERLKALRKEWGARGGALTAQRGSEFYKNIRRKRKTYGKHRTSRKSAS